MHYWDGLGVASNLVPRAFSFTPWNPGCNKLASLHNPKCQNRVCGETVCTFRLGPAFKRWNFEPFCSVKVTSLKWNVLIYWKAKILLHSTDWLCKSLLFQSLPNFLPVKEDNILKNKRILWFVTFIYFPFPVRSLDHFVASLVFMKNNSCSNFQ